MSHTEAATLIKRESYDADYLASPLRLSTAARVAELLAPFNPDTVLDLGAGTGRLTKECRRLLPMARLTLNDLNESLLAVARGHFSGDENVEYHVGSFVSLPFNDSTIDACISAYALHHVPDTFKLQTALEITRVLRPGGVCVIADQMTFAHSVEGDSDAINSSIENTFYAHRPAGYWRKKLNGAKEFTISGIAMEALISRAGMTPVLMQSINEIAGIIVAIKKG